jgi:hypothetical protein
MRDEEEEEDEEAVDGKVCAPYCASAVVSYGGSFSPSCLLSYRVSDSSPVGVGGVVAPPSARFHSLRGRAPEGS